MEQFSNQTWTFPQINLKQFPKASKKEKMFPIFLQISIFAFTISLVWFSFVYYPKIIDKFSKVGIPQPRIPSKAVNFGEFPVETDQFRIVYEQKSDTYYAFIEGDNINEFKENKNASNLALKNALSIESVCSLKVIYAPVVKLDISQDLKNPEKCR